MDCIRSRFFASTLGRASWFFRAFSQVRDIVRSRTVKSARVQVPDKFMHWQVAIFEAPARASRVRGDFIWSPESCGKKHVMLKAIWKVILTLIKVIFCCGLQLSATPRCWSSIGRLTLGSPFTVQVADEVADLAVAVKRQFLHAQHFQLLQLVEDPWLEETDHVFVQMKLSQSSAGVEQVFVEAGEFVAGQMDGLELFGAAELPFV